MIIAPSWTQNVWSLRTSEISQSTGRGAIGLQFGGNGQTAGAQRFWQIDSTQPHAMSFRVSGWNSHVTENSVECSIDRYYTPAPSNDTGGIGSNALGLIIGSRFAKASDKNPQERYFKGNLYSIRIFYKLLPFFFYFLHSFLLVLKFDLILL